MFRSFGIFLLMALALAFSAPGARAVTKTVNGITVDVDLPQAQRGVLYDFQISPSGGVGPYSFAITSGVLPTGLTMSSSGEVSGASCRNNGSFPFDVLITDSNGTSASFSGTNHFSINMTAGPANGCSLTLSAISTSGTAGSSYNQTITASGAIGTVTYSIVSGSLPTGLTLSSSGTLSGTPTSSGSFTFTVRGTDTAAASGLQTYTVSIAPPSALTLASSPSPSTQVGVAYSQSNTASGGVSPYAYAISAGALPAGLNLNAATGLVSGTPTTAGPFSYTVRASDSTNPTAQTATQTVSGTIASAPQPFTLSSSPSPSTQVGVSYSQSNTASGGSAPYVYTISAGALPAGLSLNTATGLVSGTPTSAGPFSYTVRASDSTSPTAQTATQTVSGAIAPAAQPFALSSSASPATQVGVAYSQSNTASGGSAPYIYTVSAGVLPAGLSLNASTGLVSGTPTTAGPFSYTIRASDSTSPSPQTAAQTVSGTIAPAAQPFALSSSPSPSAQVGVAYSQSNTASGGVAPYVYAVSAGALPSGLSLNASTGLVSGTPTTAGPFSYTIRASDSTSPTAQAATQTISGTIAPAAQPFALSSSPSPNAQVGAPYSQSNTASGGVSPYAYSISAGALPAGLSLNTSTGLVSGTPTTAGPFSYTIRASDSTSPAAQIAAQTVSGTIAPAAQAFTLSSSPSPSTQAGMTYSQSNTASGGTGPYIYSISAGALPAGLSLDASTGLVSGTPTTTGPFSYTIRASDSTSPTPQIATQTLSGTIAPAAQPFALSSSASPATQVGVAYSQSNTASGGTGPYAYAISAGALPMGLSLNTSTGLVSGTPTTAGPFSYTIRASDSTNPTAQITTQTVSGTIAPAAQPFTLSSSPSPSTQVGVAYSQSNTTSGGSAPYSYAISAGALPAGLSLNTSTGLVSGTPTTAGPFSYTVRASDSTSPAAQTAAQTVSGTIAAAAQPFTLASSPAPSARVGTAYSQSNTASGGVAPYAYGISAGALPAGLSLNTSTGLVSGTPTTAGPFSYTIRASDSTNPSAQTATQTVSGTIAPAAGLMLASSPSSLTQVGTAYSQSNTASGGTAPYVYAISAGTLPAGLSLNASTGLVLGSPTTAGPFSYTVRATDRAGASAVQTVNGSISRAGTTTTLDASSVSVLFRRPVTLSATVSGRSPTGSITFRDGSIVLATVTLAGGAAKYTTDALALGAHSITATYGGDGNNAASASRPLTLSVKRPSPVDDAELRGTITAQVETARRFADTQATNVMRRLEDLHEGGCGFSQSLALAPAPQSGASDLRGRIDSTGPEMPPSPGERFPNEPRKDRTGTSPAKCTNFGVWAGGAINYGRYVAAGPDPANRFSTSGITTGLDYRVSDGLRVGFAIGFGSDRTDIGGKGTQLASDSISGIAYASLKPWNDIFIDGLVGYGSLHFNSRRFLTYTNAYATGTRSGENVFASLSLSTEFRREALKISPYIRSDVVFTTLNPYREYGSEDWALALTKASTGKASATLGVRALMPVAMSWGLLVPTVRFEYQHGIDGALSQGVAYASGQSDLFIFKADEMSRDAITGILGLRASVGETMSVDLEYGATTSFGNAQSQSVRTRVDLRW